MEDDYGIDAFSNSSDYYYDTSENDTVCGFPGEEQYLTWTKFNLILEGYCNITLSVFGIIANILAICVFSKKSFKSNFNNLLISLAVCDLLFLVISISESVRRTFQDQEASNSTLGGQLTQIHHLLLPHFLYPLHNILLSISIFMTVSISIERYLAIFHPLVYRNRSYSWNLVCHILPVLIVSCLINIPKFLESKVEMVEGSTYIVPTELRMHELYSFIYQNCTRLLLLGVVPLSLLIFLNIRVFTAINSRKSSSKDRSYSVILLLIVAIFIICHVPRVVLNIYETIEMEQISKCGPPFWSFYFITFSNSLLPVLNATLNFFIYFFAGKKFRKALFAMISCKKQVTISGVVSKTSFRTGDTRLNINSEVRNSRVRENIQMTEFRKSKVYE